MINKTKLIDSVIRVTLFTFICLWFSNNFTNFQYSLLSYSLFIFTLAAIALPKEESIIVYILIILIHKFSPKLSVTNLFLNDGIMEYDIEILKAILISTSITPILIFSITKKVLNINQYASTTIFWLLISWIIYCILVPFIYAISAGVTTESSYVKLFSYLFSKNIIIFILLGAIDCILGIFIWNAIEKRNYKIFRKN